MSAVLGAPECRHFVFLPSYLKSELNVMEMTVTVVAVLCICSVAICQIIRNRGGIPFDDERKSLYPIILLMAGTSMAVGLLAPSGTRAWPGMPDMFPAVTALWIMSSFVSDFIDTRRWVISLLGLESLVMAYRACTGIGLFPVPDRTFFLVWLSLMAVFHVSLLIYGLVSRLNDVKSVMKNGTVWTIVCIAVDVVYVMFAIASLALWQIGLESFASIMMCGLLAAMGIRIMTDSQFVLWRNQERIIMESMKVTSVAAADESRIDEVYRDLYERVVCYFEMEQPYLNHNLTINEIVKELYSNKLYVSRAISQFTGRNFCQFVNYYRVIHSVESFRKNPEYKVHELASLCGFNSTVSFNMAFRLFMGENPSEWCRKEKSAIIKKKK